ncbi:MAG: tRNA (adenosine(37)-N6)-dimethylallyltransferase MiaA [Pseudomonadota bacterium]
MGPTAAGKTELAVELVRRLPLEIISVDSALVYRGMDIGTAKPDEGVLRRAPHRLLDICDPAESYSVARFRADALREMRTILAAGGVPLLVGGTMLYFRALQEGLSDLPSADPELRRRLLDEGRRLGWQAMHARLGTLDPASAERIHPNDPQRILRALEVYELTGQSLSSWHEREARPNFPFRVLKLILAPGDRQVLRERIAARFRGMLAQGLEAEVAALLARPDVHRDLPSMRSVGYRQVAQFLDGEISREEMVEKGVAATRQLAKRQYTWLRRERGAHWLEPDGRTLTRAVDLIGTFIRGVDLN